MYGAVPLRHRQEGAARPQARRDGSIRVKHGDCSPTAPSTGIVYNTRRVMEGVPGDQAGPHLPLGRGMVRLCALVAVPCARAAAMGAAAALEELAEALSHAALRQAWKASSGRRASVLKTSDPKDARLLSSGIWYRTRRKMRIRVYETDSVHKIDVGAAPGLHRSHVLRRGLHRPGRRLGLPRGGVHDPRIDVAELRRSSRRWTWPVGRWSSKATNWCMRAVRGRDRDPARAVADHPIICSSATSAVCASAPTP